MSLCEETGFERELRDTVYWVAQLRYIGCTGHAHEVAVVFGDEIETRARTLEYDAANTGASQDDMSRLLRGEAPGCQ